MALVVVGVVAVVVVVVQVRLDECEKRTASRRSCCSSVWAVLLRTVVLTPTACSTSVCLLIDAVSPIIPRPLSGRWPRWLSRQPSLLPRPGCGGGLWWWWFLVVVVVVGGSRRTAVPPGCPSCGGLPFDRRTIW